MDMYFYYINSDYIEFLKKYEKDRRSFTCVPNAGYWSAEKFTFGAVLEVNGIQYFVPVSSYEKKQQDVILMTDKYAKDKTKRNKVLGSLRFTYMIPLGIKNQASVRVLGSLRFTYMIPAPKECIIKLDINKMPTPNSRIHVAKELAFCRRNRDKIKKQAQKTYKRVTSNADPDLTKNSCDFLLLEEACRYYCSQNHIEFLKSQKESE